MIEARSLRNIISKKKLLSHFTMTGCLREGVGDVAREGVWVWPCLECREGKRPLFIPLYQFHPLTNIQTFICNYHVTLIVTLVFTRCHSMRFTTLLNNQFHWWLCNVFCLLEGLILGFCYSNLTRETSGFELLSTINLVSDRTNQVF